MGLGDTLKTIAKANLLNGGTISGSAWPFAAFIGYKKDNGEGKECLEVTKPDNTTEYITHDMVQCATVMAMGITKVDANGRMDYGIKYLCVLKDGRQAVITSTLNSQYNVEKILF